MKHGLKHRTADRQHEHVSRNHLFTFAFTIHLANNEPDIAEAIVVETNLVLSLMVGLVICQFSSPTDMASVLRSAVSQGKIYLSAVSIRVINWVETETAVISEI